MPHYKLFAAPGSCALAVHIALREAEFPDAEVAIVKGGPNGMMVGDEPLTKYNPKGRVPALQVDGGDILTEGPVINQYLQSKSPEKLYFPTEGKEKWEALAILNFITADFHKGLALFFKPYLTGDARETHKNTEVKRNLKYLDELLDGKKWLLGDKVSFLDFYAYVVTTWAFKFDVPLDEFKNILAWGKRVEELPSTKQALEEEGLPTRF